MKISYETITNWQEMIDAKSQLINNGNVEQIMEVLGQSHEDTFADPAISIPVDGSHKEWLDEVLDAGQFEHSMYGGIGRTLFYRRDGIYGKAYDYLSQHGNVLVVFTKRLDNYLDELKNPQQRPEAEPMLETYLEDYQNLVRLVAIADVTILVKYRDDIMKGIKACYNANPDLAENLKDLANRVNESANFAKMNADKMPWLNSYLDGQENVKDDQDNDFSM